MTLSWKLEVEMKSTTKKTENVSASSHYEISLFGRLHTSPFSRDTGVWVWTHTWYWCSENCECLVAESFPPCARARGSWSSSLFMYNWCGKRFYFYGIIDAGNVFISTKIMASIAIFVRVVCTLNHLISGHGGKKTWFWPKLSFKKAAAT